VNGLANDAMLLIAHRWPRRLWLLAIPLALGWFFFWLMLWNPEVYDPPGGVPRFAPHARFLPGHSPAADRAAQHDLRVMWSPVLFALPTPMGFSRTPDAGDGHDRPRVQRPSMEPRLLMAPCAATNTLVVSDLPLPVFADGVRFRMDRTAPVFAGMPTGTNSLTVEVVGGLANIPAANIPLPPLPAVLAADSWTVIAYVDVGRFGEVEHVFLDPPSSSVDFNAQLLQALYRWRFVPVAGDLHGIIHLHHAFIPQQFQPTPQAALR